jgi:hypothetical protein
VASLCSPSEAALLGDRHEILHLSQLDLDLHLINVSENEGVEYCFFKRTISSEAIIGDLRVSLIFHWVERIYQNSADYVPIVRMGLKFALPLERKAAPDYCSRWNNASQKVIIGSVLAS